MFSRVGHSFIGWFLRCVGAGNALTAPAPPFLCQLSSMGSGELYTPSIPDFYFNHESAGSFRTATPAANLTTLVQDIIYIFTIPAVSAERDCSGNVLAMQFCYEYTGDDSNIGNTINAFEFLTFTREEFAFTMTDSFTVQTTLSESVCTDDLPGDVQRVCCSYAISDRKIEELEIPSSEYTFGIALNGEYDFELLAFTSEYFVDQFQVVRFDLPPGSLLTPARGHTLPLLRFSIGNGESCSSLILHVRYTTVAKQRLCSNCAKQQYFEQI